MEDAGFVGSRPEVRCRCVPDRPGSPAAWAAQTCWLRATVLAMVLAFVANIRCRAGAWNDNAEAVPILLLHRHLPPVRRGRIPRRESCLSRPRGRVPGADRRCDAGRGLAGLHTSANRPGVAAFYDVTGGAARDLCRARWCSQPPGRTGPDRRRQALMVAFSPGLILCAFINWDLLAFALTALWLAAWSARRSGVGGESFSAWPWRRSSTPSC